MAQNVMDQQVILSIDEVRQVVEIVSLVDSLIAPTNDNERLALIALLDKQRKAMIG